MDSFPINWSSRLSQVSCIPTDITFKFTDTGSSVTAHKMILAMASDIFMNMFYTVDTKDKSASEITIEDTTEPAFRIMIDAIYSVKPIKESLQGKTVNETFAVLHLVSKYNIPELMLAVKDYISSYSLTEDSVLDTPVLEVAGAAIEHLPTYKEDSQKLLIACLNFLKTKFKDMNSFLQVVAKNGEHMSSLHKLAVLADGLPPCPNCSKDACQNGDIVPADQFRVGLIVTNNCLSDQWDSDITFWKGEVVEIASADTVKVNRECKYVDDNEIQIVSGIKTTKINYEGEPKFRFYCF